jgi:hypothetical protein
MPPNEGGPYWSAARYLIAQMGLDEAYHYAFGRSHPHMSFGADPDPHARLVWGKVATRIRWIHAKREHERREAELEADRALLRRGRRGLEVRS